MNTNDLPALQNALLMLDFDGTLVDLAATPDSIAVPKTLGAALNALHRSSRGLTLITGRAIDDLTQYLPDFVGDVYGSHGGEKRLAGAYAHTTDVAQADLMRLWACADALAKTDAALIAEHKPTGVVVHFRRAPHLEAHVNATMAALVADMTGLSIRPSKMATEVRPDGVSKADAAGAIIARAAKDATPVFAGDDTTDEDAMQVVNTAGGITIKIGAGATCAKHRLPTPDALRQLMQNWSQRTLT